jgi:acyl carrier protein
LSIVFSGILKILLPNGNPDCSIWGHSNSINKETVTNEFNILELNHLILKYLPAHRKERKLEADLSFFDDLDFDSVAFSEFLLDCQDRFAISFPDEVFGEGPVTIGMIADYIAKALNRRE